MKSRKGKTISENLTELACGSYILVFEKGSRALQLSMFSFLPNDYDHDYCSFYRRESSNNTDWAILTLLRNKIFVHIHLQNKQFTLKFKFRKNTFCYIYIKRKPTQFFVCFVFHFERLSFLSYECPGLWRQIFDWSCSSVQVHELNAVMWPL